MFCREFVPFVFLLVMHSYGRKKSDNWKKQFSGHHVVYSVKAKHISQNGLSLSVMNVIYVNILKLEDTHSRIMQIQFRPRFRHESEYFPCFFHTNSPRMNQQIHCCLVWKYGNSKIPDSYGHGLIHPRRTFQFYQLHVNIQVAREVFHTLQNFLLIFRFQVFDIKGKKTRASHKNYY